MTYNANRAYAPTSELAIMTIMFNNDNNGQPIGQYGLIKISTSSYIQILGVITKFRNIYRTLFK